jgi:hypothetical protein
MISNNRAKTNLEKLWMKEGAIKIARKMGDEEM